MPYSDDKIYEKLNKLLDFHVQALCMLSSVALLAFGALGGVLFLASDRKAAAVTVVAAFCMCALFAEPIIRWRLKRKTP